MCANVTPTTSLPSIASRRSLLSRLTSPLKSRTRNLADFHIRLKEPHRKYSPGDLVQGHVVLTVLKAIRVTHLTVCLHGFVRVFKNPNAANEPLPAIAGLTTSNGSQRTQYFGNGHVSLFQDEQTMCGDGRLDVGIWEFGFDLEFPPDGLPSSIDFERGTISYMISATLTRPTSIAPTSNCDHKISLVETVDIGALALPKARTISLEPILRKSRRKKTEKVRGPGSQTAADAGSGSDAPRATSSPHPDDSASQCGDGETIACPRSPVPSEIVSTVSAATTGTGSTTSSSTGLSFRLGPVPSSKSKSNTGSSFSVTNKTITATIELLKSGCLPGENVPLKIVIKHTKAIKSMHGIIITLYRQGRIDSAPPLSLFVDYKGKAAEKLKHEEYYPKSKTGLGGLSLSSAGSSSIFRKDLAQTFAPILVDPLTLTTTVQASVRCPEDVFPTISGVPGEMISFKYYVEVVVDLGGKLAGQQMHVPRVGSIALPSAYGRQEAARDGSSNMLATWGGSIVDTDHIRREKSVVACLFEVTVGTTDSARTRGRGNSLSRRHTNEWAEETPRSPAFAHDPIYEESYNQDEQQSRISHPEYHHNHIDQYSGYHHHNGHEERGYDDYSVAPPSHPDIYVPPPEFSAEEGLSEKERARRAEERLLPSQPPTDNGGSSSNGGVLQVSAQSVVEAAPPSVAEPNDLYDADDPPPHRPATSSSTHNELTTIPVPSAPTLEDLAPAGANPTDDKQELERQRMLAEASAPSDFLNDEDHNGEGSSGAQHEASAPVLTEDDEYEGQYSQMSLPGHSQHDAVPEYRSSAPEDLPRYER